MDCVKVIVIVDMMVGSCLGLPDRRSIGRDGLPSVDGRRMSRSSRFRPVLEVV